MATAFQTPNNSVIWLKQSPGRGDDNERWAWSGGLGCHDLHWRPLPNWERNSLPLSNNPSVCCGTILHGPEHLKGSTYWNARVKGCLFVHERLGFLFRTFLKAFGGNLCVETNRMIPSLVNLMGNLWLGNYTCVRITHFGYRPMRRERQARPSYLYLSYSWAQVASNCKTRTLFCHKVLISLGWGVCWLKRPRSKKKGAVKVNLILSSEKSTSWGHLKPFPQQQAGANY